MDEGEFAKFLRIFLLDVDFIETCTLYDRLTESDWRKIHIIRRGLETVP
jgi:helix-turn-helix protein